MWQELKQALLDIFHAQAVNFAGPRSRRKGCCVRRAGRGSWSPGRWCRKVWGAGTWTGCFFSFIMKGASGKGCTRPSLGAAGGAGAAGYEWARGMEQEALLNWGPELARAVAVVPIPTDEGRRKERGYDIPEEIFRGWCGQRGFVWRPVFGATHALTAPQYLTVGGGPEGEYPGLAGAGAGVQRAAGSGAGGRYCDQRTWRGSGRCWLTGSGAGGMRWRWPVGWGSRV